MRRKRIWSMLFVLILLSVFVLIGRNMAYTEEGNIVMEITDQESTEGGEENEMEGEEEAEAEASEIKKKLDELCSVSTIIVAVIDTGLDFAAFEQKERVIDIQRDLSDDAGINSLTDENGHGTIMAEIIAENSGECVRIMPIKVTDEKGRATVSKVCQAIALAQEHGAKIINISMNTLNSATSKLLSATIDQAVEAGITVVVSAGNKSVDVKDIAPANVESATVISATNRRGTFADYSNYGATIDYCAPGYYNGKSGTSYAAAYYSGVLAEVMSKGYEVDFLKQYLWDRGEPGWDPYYGHGVVSLSDFENNDFMEDLFGEDWEETRESSILKMNDFHLVTNSKIDSLIAQSDLADVGYYLSTLNQTELEELLARDTILMQKVCFCESNLTNEELRENGKIEISQAQESFYYEKCLEVYEKESKLLGTSARYLHKTGCFRLSFVDRTGAGKSTTYEICVRVCLENKALDGSSASNGRPTDRNVTNVGEAVNSLTVWSKVSSGCSDTMKLQWQNTGGAYAQFLSDDSGGQGRVFVPNIAVLCPAYTLMYTADASHANGGSNCTGRSNFFTYSKSNANASSYASYKSQFRLRKYGMQPSASYHSIGPQLNTSHMNLSDTSRNQTTATTICTMYVYLNNPAVTLRVNPNGEKWGGKSEVSSLSVINSQSYELGTPTVTNYRATFYGGGDALDPVADSSINTDKTFSHWSLECSANGSGQIGSNHSYMNGTTFVAGRVEYDKNSKKSATTGEKVTATAVFSGSNTIVFPAAPVRTGYTFAGWYTGVQSGAGSLACSRENAGKATVTLSQDCEYHAEWTKNQYTVSFYSGEDLLKEKAYLYRSDIDLSASEQVQDINGTYYIQRLSPAESLQVSKDEYVLVGWSLTRGGEVVSSVNVPANNATCLYAVWSRPTSGMKQVAMALKSGENQNGTIIETLGDAAINLTLGLRAFFYRAKIPLTVTEEGVKITADGYSYAEDNAGNKTPLSSEAVGAMLPVRYTFIYKFYVYNAVTKQWNYLENMDSDEIADVFPGETYTYCFRPEKFCETPSGYTYHHAEFEESEILLPYSLNVTAAEEDENVIRNIDVFYYPITCTLTFDANGGSFPEEESGGLFSLSGDGTIAEKTVLYGSVIGSFPGAQKGDFYGCTGFYDRKENGNRVDMNDTVKGDMVLYAGWKAKEGIVRYDAGSNQGTVACQDHVDIPVIYETEICYEEVTAQRENYEFLGWAFQAQSTPQEEPLKLLQPSVDKLQMTERTMTLYAQFARKLSITFHQWSGTDLAVKNDGAEPVLYNNERNVYVVSPLIDDYGDWEGLGWTATTSETDGYELGELTEFCVADDCDYYALYKRKVTVTYDTKIFEQNDENEVSFETEDIGTAYRSTSGCDDILADFVIKEEPNRAYYTFAYWQGSDGKRYDPGDMYSSTEDLQLSAVWQPESAIVIFDAGTNGGTVLNEPEVYKEIEYGCEIPADAHTYAAQKENYEFLGWSTDKDAKNGLMTNPVMDAKIMDDGVLTLYAVFKRELTACFYQQGWTEPETVRGTLYNNDENVAVHAPEIDSYEGWEILGWSSGNTAKSMVELCSDTDFKLSEDAKFYALFRKEVELSYDSGIHGLDVEPCRGYTYHNSFRKSAEEDEPASFEVAGSMRAEGRSFLHWEDSEGTSHEPGEQILLWENELLRAIWDEYPDITAMDRYFTLEQATDPHGTYINEPALLDPDYVIATDREDDNRSLKISLSDFYVEDFLSLQGSADLMITYQVTDSHGNRTTATATVHVVDTAVKEDPVAKSTRFISPAFYKTDEGYVPENRGGLSDTSLWKTDGEHAECLNYAMENAKSLDRTIRYEHTFTMTEIKEIKQMIYEEGGFGKYAGKDFLPDFIDKYIKKDSD